MHIGKRIAKIRRAQNLTSEELGKKLEQELSHAPGQKRTLPSSLQSIESGRVSPESELLESLANRLNVPNDYFIHCNQEDPGLRRKLDELHSLLQDEHLDKARKIIDYIQDEYLYINSLDQELEFYLLQTLYCLKGKQLAEASQLFELEVLPIVGIEGKLPDEIRELYFYVKGTVFYYQKNYIVSNESYLTQLDLVTDESQKATACYNAALTFYHLNDIVNASKYAESAINSYLKQQKWLKAADAYTMFGGLCWESKHFDKGIEYLERALKLSKQHNFKDLEGIIYHNLGIIYSARFDSDKALNYLITSLNMQKRNYSKSIILTFFDLLKIYIEMKDVASIESTLREAKKYATETEELYRLQIIESQLNLLKNNHEVYERLLTECIDYFYENGTWKVLNNNDIAGELSEFYANQNKYELASKYLQIELEVKQKIYEEEKVI